MEPVYVVLFWMLVATGGVFVFSMISYSRIQKKRHFKCPECGHCHKPGGLAAFFSPKQNVTDRLLFCPRCGRRGYMENIEDTPARQEENSGKPADNGK